MVSTKIHTRNHLNHFAAKGWAATKRQPQLQKSNHCSCVEKSNVKDSTELQADKGQACISRQMGQNFELGGATGAPTGAPGIEAFRGLPIPARPGPEAREASMVDDLSILHCSASTMHGLLQ